MNITRENIDDLNAIVKVNIAKDDYIGKVDKILKDYKKNANIPGFRKGQVPMGIVKKQYGKSVLVDEVNKLLQEALNKYLTEEKLDVLGNPLPKEQDNFNWDQEDFSFEFELGLTPQFEVDLKTKKPITHYNIVAGEEMIKNQIVNIQKQYGKLIPKEVAEEGDVVAGTFVNDEENISNASTISIDDVKGKKNIKKLVGAKKGDVITLNTKGLFEDDHQLEKLLNVEHDRIHDLDVEVTLTVTEINHQESAELNQELFDKLFPDSEVKNVEDLKEKIREDAAKQFQQQGDQQLMNDVTEALIENNKFDLPKEFLQKWIRTAGEKPLTEEEAKEEFKNSEQGLRFQLIEGKLIRDNKLEVKFEDLKEFATARIKEQMAQFGQMNPSEKELDDIAARVLSNQDEIKRLSEQLMNEKLLGFYKENISLKEKEVTYEDFVKDINK
jgi:trigger factor